MYKQKSRFQQQRHNGSAAYGQRSGSAFRGRPQRRVKKLDPNLFIKKAVVLAPEESPTVSTLFADMAISDKLKRNIADNSYVSPTQIQEQAIPSILAGRDVIGIANTGTGKTAAFLIPLVNKVSLNREERVLIVTPTRELAMQIVDELKKFTRGMDLESLLCIGGARMDRQEKRLRHSPHFVIGTPGRLRDLIERRKLNLSLFRNIVLDEVDRMVDIGFLQDVKFFVSLLPKVRQSLFFSATMTPKATEILHSFVTNPTTVSVKQQPTSENVDQDIIRVLHPQKKPELLHDLLNRDDVEKVLVFGRTKHGIEKLSRMLEERGFRVASIHGNKTQGQRQRALSQFRENQVKILLATDVASRGLDIANVTHVINYDAPESYDDYVHRIGRTGRAGKKGFALTFVE